MDPNQIGSMSSNKKNSKLPKLKATWNYGLHKTFVDLCYEQISNRQGTSFPKDVWNNIIAEFNKRHGTNYDKKQMKNHWDSTKAEWKIWYKLKDFESGLGWDVERDIIIATDEWWSEYTQACQDAYKFRFKGIDHSEKLTDLFLEGTTTGKSAWAPSQGSLPNDSAGPFENREQNDTEKTIDLEVDTQVPEPEIADQNGEENDGENNKRKWRGKKYMEIPPPSEPRKRTSSVVTVNKHMDRICDSLETIVSRPRLEQIVPQKTNEISIKSCVGLLDQMEEVAEGSELYLFACRLFLIKEQRELFDALKPSVRLAWLESAKNPPKDV